MTICSHRPHPCIYNEFRCANEKCIDKKKICDHADDCGDLSDELGCHGASNCTSGGCEQKCSELEDSGYVCHCLRGFRISPNNKKRCVDIDECAEFTHNCSQLCTNLNGTHVCSCREGFEAKINGVCRLKEGSVTLIYSDSPEIRTYNVTSDRASYVIKGDSIESLDYEPKSGIVYWTDSYGKTIKRSYLPGSPERANVTMGYAQNLDIKSRAKPTGLAVDWAGMNLYWSETDRTGNKPRGSVLVATLDGRYCHSVIATGLEVPTSVVVDPEHGYMFWTDIGSIPKIETSWMDGSKRRILVSDAISQPTGLSIDFAMDHTIYWVDAKLNKIEMMREDGSRRTLVASGNYLKHPRALDVFEASIYWVTRDSGEIYSMDKFARGVPVRLPGEFANPTSIKVFADKRYNTSTMSICQRDTPCSHLCLIVPGGYKCACPDNKGVRNTYPNCDAPHEAIKPKPLGCGCLHGGICVLDNSTTLQCECQEGYSGELCENYVAKEYIAQEPWSAATVVVPIILIILVLAVLAALYVFFNRRHITLKGRGLPGSSVVFRQGTNVEIGPPSFMAPAEGSNGVPIEGDVNLGEMANKNHNFSNPMYDAMGSMEGAAPEQTNSKGLYEVPLDTSKSKNYNLETQESSNGTTQPPALAVLSPSAMMQKASPNIQIRKKELSPSSNDTGKDTQKLVVEDDNSEC